VVSPADIEGTAEAIFEALTMPVQERHRRAAALRRTIEEEDVNLWLRQQLVDIVHLHDSPTTQGRGKVEETADTVSQS
jgi:trehalose-6-phosphate synthase